MNLARCEFIIIFHRQNLWSTFLFTIFKENIAKCNSLIINCKDDTLQYNNTAWRMPEIGRWAILWLIEISNLLHITLKKHIIILKQDLGSFLYFHELLLMYHEKIRGS